MHEDARLVKGAAAMRTQRCYAIKSHVNGLLDVARKIYSEIIDDITGEGRSLSWWKSKKNRENDEDILMF